MTHYTNLKGPAQELFDVLDDLLAYVQHHENEKGLGETVTTAKARRLIEKYAGKVA